MLITENSSFSWAQGCVWERWKHETRGSGVSLWPADQLLTVCTGLRLVCDFENSTEKIEIHLKVSFIWWYVCAHSHYTRICILQCNCFHCLSQTSYTCELAFFLHCTQIWFNFHIQSLGHFVNVQNLLTHLLFTT